MANEDIVKKSVEILWNKKDLNACNEFFHQDVIFHRHHQDIKGLENVKKFIKEIMTAFPDYSSRILDLFAKDNKVCIRWEANGTHKGNFLGNAPTNKKIEYEGITVYHMQNNQIKEGWIQADLYGLFKQLDIFSKELIRK